jgi:hypothetical protein
MATDAQLAVTNSQRCSANLRFHRALAVAPAASTRVKQVAAAADAKRKTRTIKSSTESSVGFTESLVNVAWSGFSACARGQPAR